MKTFFISFVLGFISNMCFGQTKTDTSYYLLDTSKTPAADRIVSIKQENNNAFVNISCPCLRNGNVPVFRYNINKHIKVDEKYFSSIKAIKLMDLIELVRKNDNSSFNKQHVIFFLEPDGKNYIKRRAYFLGSYITKTS
ncbi:hypothetical protein [Mucilaginibacter sp.]|uniref:hypothetical protein n=1 Tax=Mucilaginibacter sp. TaxID=1882438 RepID=UPI000CB221A2|nr:hypothetical protein [Mucilaginibacter sp.]PLW89480.1 MAG: hypothetical protein C0154_11280 [Mucilaginibacter sp.]PMP65465.1 MAG: hypothetical protein C0191_03485 [Mucilaginibacter sp.]HEK20280.1 hypothetical protein [Bacteroidota bacterium]